VEEEVVCCGYTLEHVVWTHHRIEQ